MAGSENRKFMLVVLLSFSVVLLGVVITTLAFSINAINNNADTSIDQYKDLVRENIESELYNFSRLLRNPDINELLMRGTGGDAQNLAIALFNMVKITLGEPYYLVFVGDGAVIDSKLPGEIGKAVPQDLISDGSQEIEEFRGKNAQMVMVAASLSEDLRAVAVVDMTDEIEEARQPFEDQKDNILWISLLIFVGFLALALLMAVFVIGRANSRYISGPIKDLEDKAKRMMEGETSIAITVDENSDYYALQALLDSMQHMLQGMESRSEE